MHKLFVSPFFNVALLSICWALQIFVTKLAFIAGANLFTFSIQYMIVTALLLTLLILPRKIKELKKLSPKILTWLLITGAISSGFGAILGNAGISLTSAINSGFLLQFDIAITIILAWLLLKEKLDLAKIITLSAILVGTFLFTTNGQVITPHLGDIFILLSCICFASASVYTRKIFKDTTVDPDLSSLLRPFAALPILLVAVILAPLYPETIRQNFVINLFDFRYFPYVLLNAFFVVGIIMFLNRTLKLASASYTAMMASVTPILVAILGFVVLRETLSNVQMIGAICIISASFITHVLKVDKH